MVKCLDVMEHLVLLVLTSPGRMKRMFYSVASVPRALRDDRRAKNVGFCRSPSSYPTPGPLLIVLPKHFVGLI